jgi:competence protein ComEC
LILLALANLYLWQFLLDLEEENLEVVFFNIGQGDAIFVETPSNYQILIDGGPDETIVRKLAGEIPFWDRTIDLVILTHPEKDHLAGLIDVLERYHVKNILWTGVIKETDIFQLWSEKMSQEKARIVIAKAGERIEKDNIILDIIFPSEDLEGKLVEDGNDNSLVAHLIFKNTSFLFTGDITSSAEEEIISESEQENVRADVLKVAHHGSKTSSSRDFLSFVNPEIAVISCGLDNPYGHPHLSVLENLEEFAINILRTDIDGDIKITSDGFNLVIQ